MGARLRRARQEHGLSLSELARRSGLGKGTVSELENGLRGARLDTLFALSTALEIPLGALLPGSDGQEPAAVQGESVTAVALGSWRSGSGMIEAYRATVTPRHQHSQAHQPGVEETVTVIRGRVRVGTAGDERELGPGEGLRYRGDTPHTFAGADGDAEVLLLMHYPTSPVDQEGASHGR